MTETPEQRLAIVRAEIRARQERDRLFAGLHARDPRWAMILELEAAAFSDAPWIVMGKLIETVGTARTTGLRIVDALVAGGWLLTERNGGDGRQRLLALSPQALQRLGRANAIPILIEPLTPGYPANPQTRQLNTTEP